jgi:hypothetical protein
MPELSKRMIGALSPRGKPFIQFDADLAGSGVRIQDLRHSVASFGAGESLGLAIIGKLLEIGRAHV